MAVHKQALGAWASDPQAHSGDSIALGPRPGLRTSKADRIGTTTRSTDPLATVRSLGLPRALQSLA
eukprot:15415896-Alexandrium_andersonii.AAC.1